MRMRPPLTYTIAGILLGAGAPAGALLIRFLAIAQVRQDPLEDLSANAFFYLYDLLGTSLMFAVGGFVAGRRAERLRRGEQFYLELSEHDALTGLHNDRAFADRYRRALERAVATQRPLSILLVDIDELKGINDSFGHPAGNQALIHVGDAMRHGKRSADIAARWGGDEFAILLEGADTPAAMRVAERILARLRSDPIDVGKATVTVTVTIGLCCAIRHTPSSDLFTAADRALFAGKEHGRNTIEVVSI
jgi:diguanylate cyclase (GGDEF)-like protein